MSVFQWIVVLTALSLVLKFVFWVGRWSAQIKRRKEKSAWQSLVEETTYGLVDEMQEALRGTPTPRHAKIIDADVEIQFIGGPAYWAGHKFPIPRSIIIEARRRHDGIIRVQDPSGAWTEYFLAGDTALVGGSQKEP